MTESDLKPAEKLHKLQEEGGRKESSSSLHSPLAAHSSCRESCVNATVLLQHRITVTLVYKIEAHSAESDGLSALNFVIPKRCALTEN